MNDVPGTYPDSAAHLQKISPRAEAVGSAPDANNRWPEAVHGTHADSRGEVDVPPGGTRADVHAASDAAQVHELAGLDDDAPGDDKLLVELAAFSQDQTADLLGEGDRAEATDPGQAFDSGPRPIDHQFVDPIEPGFDRSEVSPPSDSVQAGAGGAWTTIDETAGGAVAQLSDSSCVSACGEMLSGRPQYELIDAIDSPSNSGRLAAELGPEWKGGFVGPSAFDVLNANAPWAGELFTGERLHHMVVIDGLDSENFVRIRDPWDGGSTYRMTTDEFRNVWTGIATFPTDLSQETPS